MEVIDRKYALDEEPIVDNSTDKENLINISPVSGSDLNKNGTINFVIESCDQYLVPSESYLYLEGILTKDDDTLLKKEEEVTLTNNAPMFLFDRASYSLNGNQIEDIYDPGRASLINPLCPDVTYMSHRLFLL